MNNEILDDTISFLKQEYNNMSDPKIFIIAFTGGTESVIIKDIFDKYLPDYKYLLLYKNSGFETDGFIETLQNRYPDLILLNNIDFSILDTWVKYNRIPTSNDRFCCKLQQDNPTNYKQILAEHNITYPVCIQGKRQMERCRLNIFVPLKTEKRKSIILNPLRKWSDTDISEYINDNPEIKTFYKKQSRCVGCVRFMISREVREQKLKDNPIAAQKMYEAIHKIYTNNTEIQEKFETEQKYINSFLGDKTTLFNNKEEFR